MPERDGPYVILKQKCPTTFVIFSIENPAEPLATCHTSTLKLCNSDNTPVASIRKRGRPPKNAFLFTDTTATKSDRISADDLFGVVSCSKQLFDLTDIGAR